MIKTNTIDYVLFRFVAWNTPNLNKFSKLTKFKFSDLLSQSLKRTIMYTKLHNKEYHKRVIIMGIMRGEISVMRLGTRGILYL